MAAVAAYAGLGFLPAAAAGAPAAPIALVAAENFYGDIARQIGGTDVAVTSILSNPDQDPHEFEASPSTARAFASAAVVVYNGAGYDPWAEKLLAASPRLRRAISSASRQLVHRETADNPHLWYDPRTMPVVAEALRGHLQPTRSGACAADYRAPPRRFEHSLAPLTAEICGVAQQISRNRGRRDRAGVRLHGRCAGPRDARPPFPAGDDERHRTERHGHRRLRSSSFARRRSSY